MISKPYLLLVLTLMCFVGAGCSSSTAPASPQAPNSAMNSNNSQNKPLKETLEDVYAQTRALMEDATPDRYLAALDLTGADTETVSDIRGGWANRKENMPVTAPDLTGPQTKFIQLVTEGDWAGYYFITDTGSDPSFVMVQRFHKTGDLWKVGTKGIIPQPRSAFTQFNAEALKELIKQSAVMGVMPTGNSNSIYNN